MHSPALREEPVLRRCAQEQEVRRRSVAAARAHIRCAQMLCHRHQLAPRVLRSQIEGLMHEPPEQPPVDPAERFVLRETQTPTCMPSKSRINTLARRWKTAGKLGSTARRSDVLTNVT